MEFDALFVGFAPAGGADGGGFFVEGGAVFVEQDLLLLELCREEEVFRQPPQEFNALTQSPEARPEEPRGPIPAFPARR